MLSATVFTSDIESATVSIFVLLELTALIFVSLFLTALILLIFPATEEIFSVLDEVTITSSIALDTVEISFFISANRLIFSDSESGSTSIASLIFAHLAT